MTIIQQLQDDHIFFMKTFQELETLTDSPVLEENILRASGLVQGFRDRHRTHLHLESSVLFPTLLGYLQMEPTPLTRSAIYHHLQEEHMGMGRQFHDLELDLVSRPLNAAWLKSYRELANVFIPHMRDEEEHIFPEASRMMPQEQLESMANPHFFPALKIDS